MSEKIKPFDSRRQLFQKTFEEQSSLDIENIMDLHMSLSENGDVEGVINKPSKLKIFGALDEIPYYLVRLNEPQNRGISTSMHLNFIPNIKIEPNIPVNATTSVEETKEAKPPYQTKFVCKTLYFQNGELIATGQTTYLSINENKIPKGNINTHLPTDENATELEAMGILKDDPNTMTINTRIRNNMGGVHGSALAMFSVLKSDFTSAKIKFKKQPPSEGKLYRQENNNIIKIIDDQENIIVETEI